MISNGTEARAYDPGVCLQSQCTLVLNDIDELESAAVTTSSTIWTRMGPAQLSEVCLADWSCDSQFTIFNALRVRASRRITYSIAAQDMLWDIFGQAGMDRGGMWLKRVDR